MGELSYMFGIIGVVVFADVQEHVVDSPTRLDYPGHSNVGVAVMDCGSSAF